MSKIRILGDDIHYHVIVRSSTGGHVFQCDEDCERLLDLLFSYANRFDAIIYNYVIMHSHMHLMLSTQNGNTLDKVMHGFCLAAAKDYNKRHQCIGHLWRHRYRSKVIDNDRYALACLRYIHRNPVAAGLVRAPDDWPWSAYRYYSSEFENPPITLHPSYFLLGGASNEERQQAYRELTKIDEVSRKNETAFLEGRLQRNSRRYQYLAQQVFRPLPV
ncbi:MAG: transposase [Deltaproteobacteria bacterium]|nr:transposase [Deltaproteobacteria bacterium]